MISPNSAATLGIGYTLMQVKIREILSDRKLAVCISSEGQYVEVTTAIQRTGIELAVGQTWLVDRTYGHWSFAAKLDLT